MGQIPTTPTMIPMPFAQNGERGTIPETNSVAGSANASWSTGFPAITRISKNAGGKPPLGVDFQSIFYGLSNHQFFQQSGSKYPWNAALNYLAGCEVMGSDGNAYRALLPSGPDVPSGGGYVGAIDPVNDADAKTYWTNNTAILTNAVTVFDGNLYIDGTNGDDSNDGLTSGTAVKTIGKAIELGGQYQSLYKREEGYGPTYCIHVAHGTYTEDVLIANGLNVFFFLDENGVTIDGSFNVLHSSMVFVYDGPLTVTGDLNVRWSAKFFSNESVTANTLTVYYFATADFYASANFSNRVYVYSSLLAVEQTGSFTCSGILLIRYNSTFIANNNITIKDNNPLQVMENSFAYISKTLTIETLNNAYFAITAMLNSVIRADAATTKFVINGSIASGNYGAINVSMNSSLYLSSGFTKEGTVTGNDKIIARGGQVYTGGLGVNALTFTGSTQKAVETASFGYMA